MELILVRHALPERKELAAGAADPSLTEEGHRQAEHLAEYLSTEEIDTLYVSPMARARQTAVPVEQRLGLDATVVDGVAEYDRESSEYIPIEQLKAEGDPRFHDFVNEQWAGQEERDRFTSAVRSATDQIIADNPGNRVVVVCHGGVINVVLSDVLGLTPDGPGFFYPNYTSIHRVAASRSGVRSIVTINETSHLRNTGLPMGLFQQG